MSMQEIFTDIYKNNKWGTECKSGPGSTIQQNKGYIALIHNLLRAQNIESVVDFGCGDWSFSKYISWGNVDYLGIDVVPDLILNLQSQFATSEIDFMVADLINTNKRGDLLLIKDVLHHLSNEHVMEFIKNQLPRFRMALITNDTFRGLLSPGDDMSLKFFMENCNIEDGESRPLDIRKEPFCQNVLPLLTTNRIETIGKSKIHFRRKTFLWVRTEL